MNLKILIFGYSTTFEVDEHTLDTIKGMRTTFGVKRPSQVIRKALAFAKVCAENADENGIVRFRNGDGSITSIDLRN